MKIDGNQIKVGNILEIQSRLYRVLKTQHTQPGKGGAYIQVEIKDIKNGYVINSRHTRLISDASALDLIQF